MNRVTNFFLISIFIFALINFISNDISNEIEDQYLSSNKMPTNTTIYKENILAKNHLGNIKSSNRLINIMASIYAEENTAECEYNFGDLNDDLAMDIFDDILKSNKPKASASST